MGAYQNSVQRAVVLALAVVSALVNGAFDTSVGMAVHRRFLLCNDYRASMAENVHSILEKTDSFNRML